MTFFGALGGLLPGYIEGQRNAIKDNWADLDYYNRTQAGQIQNAFSEATFNPRLHMAYDQAAMSRNNADVSAWNRDVRMMQQPGRMTNAWAYSYGQPYIAPFMQLAQLRNAYAAANGMGFMGMMNPMMGGGQGDPSWGGWGGWGYGPMGGYY